MGNNVRTIYLYIVAFITLAMVVTGITSAVNNIASYFFPDAYVFFEEVDDDYSYTYNNYNYDHEYYEEKEEELEIERENYKTEKIKNTVVSLVVIIIGAIMYKYHWNMIEKENTISDEK